MDMHDAKTRLEKKGSNKREISWTASKLVVDQASRQRNHSFSSSSLIHRGDQLQPHDPLVSPPHHFNPENKPKEPYFVHRTGRWLTLATHNANAPKRNLDGLRADGLRGVQRV